MRIEKLPFFEKEKTMPFHYLFFLTILGILFLSACTPTKATIEVTTHTPTSISTNTPLPSPTNTLKPTPTPTPIAESTTDGVRVNYIYNEGFLITVGEKRILIDTIYHGYPGGVLKPILESQPPFDNVDLILATHEHHDHFDPELVLQYLQNNPDTLFASTPNAVNAILILDNTVRPRLTAIELEAGESIPLTLASINLEAIHLDHGMPGILNLGFIITFDEATLLHIGDMDPTEVSVSDLRAYGLPSKQIDIAFVHDWLITEEEFNAHITKGIQARFLIPMHFGMQPPTQFESTFPTMTILQEAYESWVLP
jgi:L-ascorbate metabolism protein UlaG (beta-lactamase superfamily)